MLESFSITPEVDLESFRPAFEAGGYLGAASANVQVRADEQARMVDRFGRVCEMAREYGLVVATEMSRRMALKTVPEGVAFLKQVGASNARLLIDTLHFFRFDQPVESLAEGEGLIGRIQLCDGRSPAPPADEQLQEAMHDRLPAGEGVLPLREFLAAIPEDILIGIEVPMRELQQQGVSAAERAALNFRAARKLIASLPA